ncbi:hypothetical protein LVJ82_03405 [Vitreoscilla massiliensis]|uniref:Uncharacterized protein n=1 Tax=Vitreoscilla massiliensis TaxID=1689272 RepID=A0ABY4E434_9NEIS|nr:hypothetical protein [Vitreoscilla massiliensis]UOO90049.1 hypothetical protein LVJ82_03405 [Vitreoscilla massiliensis]
MPAQSLPKLPLPLLIAAVIVWGLCWYFVDKEAAFKLALAYAALAWVFLYLRPQQYVTKSLLSLLLLGVLPLFVAAQSEHWGLSWSENPDTIVGVTILLMAGCMGIAVWRRNHQAATRISVAQATLFLIRTDRLYEWIGLISAVLGLALLGLLYVLLLWQNDWWYRLIAAVFLGGVSILCWLLRQKHIETYQNTQAQGGEWIEITDAGMRWQQLQHGLDTAILTQQQLTWAQIQRLDVHENTVIVEAFEPKMVLNIRHFGPFLSANNLLNTLVKLKHQARKSGL